MAESGKITQAGQTLESQSKQVLEPQSKQALEPQSEQALEQQEACPNCCSTRHKERSEEEIKSLVVRLNRIEGQVRGIRKMVESGAYCPDILTQSAAVSAAMNSFNKQLLAAHVHSCVVEDIRNGRDETVDELCALLQKLMK